ncbi:MAG: glycosyltransferase family 4 protein, partial [Dehalococcoidia bacterium]
SPAREAWDRLRDSAKVAGQVQKLLPHVSTAFWWTEPHVPLGSAVRAFAALRRIKNVFTLANYQRSYPFHDALLRASLAGFDRIVSPCHALEEHLAGLGIPRRRLLTIPLGVDLEHFRAVDPEEKARLRGSYGVDEGAKVIAWVGPIIPPSQLDDVRFLLAAVPTIRRRVPNAVFVFAFKYGIPHHLVPAHPWVKAIDRYRDIRDVFHMADVVALPFTATDPWITVPLSMVEALACGVPVVTLRHPGLSEVVTDGESGVLVERLEGLPQAVADLCADESWLAHLAYGARRRAEESFDLRAAARDYARLLLGE